MKATYGFEYFSYQKPSDTSQNLEKLYQETQVAQGCRVVSSCTRNEEITCQDITGETVQSLLSPFHLE